MYIHIHIYICMYIYICTSIYMCIYIYMCICTCIYIYLNSAHERLARGALTLQHCLKMKQMVQPVPLAALLV